MQPQLQMLPHISLKFEFIVLRIIITIILVVINASSIAIAFVYPDNYSCPFSFSLNQWFVVNGVIQLIVICLSVVNKCYMLVEQPNNVSVAYIVWYCICIVVILLSWTCGFLFVIFCKYHDNFIEKAMICYICVFTGFVFIFVIYIYITKINGGSFYGLLTITI